MEPYCGPAPVPADLLRSWNLDPWLLGAMVVAALVWALAVAHRPNERWHFAMAYAVLGVAFISPLCALSTALFSARVFHHILLVAVAAPLLAAAFPYMARPFLKVPISVPVMAHAAMLWLWHAPGPYGWALSGNLAYWTMEATLLASAFWLWREILRPAANPGPALAALLGTVVQMGFLGALLTFASRPLFASHFLTTEPFGFTPLQDQQLAGLMMWVPGALPYIAVGLWRLAALLSPSAGGGERAP